MSTNQSSIKKTIQINPALFTISKTKKNRNSISNTTNREKKTTPLISPNQLKTQLLRRIKEHKHRENDLKEKTTTLKPQTNTTNTDIGAYTDEFEESLNYLKSLSNRKEEMQKKTLKNYSSFLSSSSGENKNKNYILPRIDLELPDTLKEVTPVFQPVNREPFQINYKVDTIVPYGVLKGGMKPTYRNFVKTQKNHNSYHVLQNNTNNKNNTTNYGSSSSSTSSPHFDLLKEKLKNKQQELQQQQEMDRIVMSQHLIQKPILPSANASVPAYSPAYSSSPTYSHPLSENTIIKINTNNETTNLENQENLDKMSMEIHHPFQPPTNTPFILNSNPTKKLLKRTIRRKYTLGKSKIKKTVGILLKDQNTRKKILTAHKDLKKTTIQDVKKYLRDHNLFKTGSNTPNDVVRKIYETAMLAGDITNQNNDILLHNVSCVKS